MAQTEVYLNPAYKLSLDILDFQYLTTNHHNNGDRIKPLWDVTKNTEYYEFEIIAKKNDQLISQNDRIIDVSSTEASFCHICNICVPKIYINEHNTSLKHKVYLELADKAMERIRKYIMNPIDVAITKPPSNTYFCISCSKAIYVNDKAKHEQTKTHVLSVKHDELLDNLLKIYNCNDTVKIDGERSPSKIDIIKEPETVKEKTTSEVKANNDVIKVVQTTKQVEPLHVNKDIIVKENVNTEIHYHFSKTENTDQIMCKLCKVTVPLIEESVVMHVNGNKHTKNYKKIISRLEKIDNKYYCKPCQVYIKENCEIDHVVEHLSLEENLKSLQSQNISTKSEHNNAFHNYIEEAGGVLTCIVCRVVFPNNPKDVNIHMNCEIHSTNLNTLMTKNKLVKRHEVYYCDLCKVLLTKNAEIVHINSGKHKSYLTAQPSINSTVNQNKPATNGNNQSTAPNVCFKTYIDMLNKKVTKNSFQLSYINDNFLEMITKDFKAKVPVNNFHGYYECDGHTHCRVCNQLVKGTKETHQLTELHMERIMMPFSNLNCIRQIDTWSHCILCNEIIENPEIHAFISNKHKVKLQDALNEHHQCNKKINETEIVSVHHVSFVNKTYCIVCSVHIDLHNFNSHLNGRSHISKYNTNFPIMSQLVDPEFEDIQNVHYHINKTSNSFEKYCKTCKLNVLNDNVDTHVKGFTHRSNYHSMLTDNRIKTVTNGYYCDVCEVYISKFTLADHAYSHTHANKIKSKAPIQKLHPHMTVNGNSVSCRVCKISIPNVPQEITKHINDMSHKKSYNSLLWDNKLKKLDKKYLCECYACELCDIILMEEEELDHILCNTDHKNKFGKNNIHHHMTVTDDPNTLLCKVCKVKIPIITSHVNNHVKCHNHVAIHNALMSGLKTINNKFYCECCRVFISHNEEIDHVLAHVSPDEHDNIIQSCDPSKNDIHPHMELSGTVLNCRVCKVPVPNNPNCITTHANGYNHKVNFNDMIKSNKIVQLDDKFLCGVCKSYNTYNGVIHHLFSDKHIKNMSPQPSSSDSVTDKAAAKDVYTCIVCSVKVPNNERNIAEHNKGSLHNANVQKLAKNITNKLCNVN